MNKEYQKKIDKYVSTLKSNGFLVIKNLISSKQCENLKSELEKLYNKMNKKNTVEGKNFGQIIIRDLVLINPDIFLPLIDINLVNNITKKILNDEFILENIMASNSINVKNKYNRIAHIDSHHPSKDVNFTTDVVAIICLDDFTKENGATKIWPKSHLSEIKIHGKNNKIKLKNKKYKHLLAKKGSVSIILAQTWHQIGQNISNKNRWSIIIHYKKWWIKPSTDFTKCGNKIFDKLNLNQKKLFGFNSISPKFNLKSKKRNYKILRNIKNISKDYRKSLLY